MFEGTEQILWCDSGLRTGTVYHGPRLAVYVCECARARSVSDRVRVDRLQVNSLILGLPFIIYLSPLHLFVSYSSIVRTTALIRFIRPNSVRESERECWDANERMGMRFWAM